MVALIVKKKRTEPEEMLKGNENSMNSTCKVYFNGPKLPSGVYRRGRRWRARIWDPKLKRNVTLGSYNMIEEAAIAVDNKRAKFLKMYGWRPNVEPRCKNVHKILEKIKRKFASTSEISDEMTGDLIKVPAGVRKLKSGKWCASIRDPNSRDRIWLGSFATAKDAVRFFNTAKAELSANKNRTDCDGFESNPMSRPGCKAHKAPMKLECEFGFGCQTSLLGSGNLNSIWADVNSNNGVGVAYVESNVVHCPPTSISDLQNLISAFFFVNQSCCCY